MNNKRMRAVLIGIAGFTHDIGKVLQKANSESYNSLPSMRYNNEIVGSKGGYYHALFTHEFLDNTLSDHRNYANINNLWKDLVEKNNDIAMTTAMHHNASASNKASLYIRDADYLSSGLDRDTDEENKHDKIKNYKQMKLQSILNVVNLGSPRSSDSLLYNHSILNSKNIFAEDKDQPTINEAQSSYAKIAELLKEDFVKLMDKFTSPDEEFLYRFADGLDGLMLKYTSLIPAATTDGELGVSLYEHSKLTAAFAASIANCSDISDQKFMLVKGEFFGIQKFIFNKESSNKNPSKILRGKSFYISLLTEIATLMLLDELELPVFNILQSGAGKFLLLAADTESYREKVVVVKEKIVDWLYNTFYGQVSFGFKIVSATSASFRASSNSSEFDKILEELNNLDHEKLTKFRLMKRKSIFDDYHKLFDTGDTLCQHCLIERAREAGGSCTKCSEYEALGDRLTKSDTLIFYRDKHGVFGEVGYSFDEVNAKEYLSSICIDIDSSEVVKRLVHYKSYVHKNKNKAVATFKELADEAHGSKMLGILKADVDNLGAIFAYGLSEDLNISGALKFRSNNTFSRFNTMSRNIHLFFSYFLPDLIKTMERKIYTVFAGGDDLLLIGSYDDIVEVALEIEQELQRYTGRNKDITLSAGISFFKASTPIWFMSEEVEHLLEKSKQREGKNSLTILGSTCTWEDFRSGRKKLDDQLTNFFKKDISTATYYKIMQFADMSSSFKDTKTYDYKLLMWRPYLHYSVSRFKDVNEDRRDDFILYLENFLSSDPKLLKALIQLRLYSLRREGVNNEL